MSVEEAKILAAEVTLSQLSTTGQAAAFTEGTVNTVCVQSVQSYVLKHALVYRRKNLLVFFFLSFVFFV
jgi:hypothetical protein